MNNDLNRINLTEIQEKIMKNQNTINAVNLILSDSRGIYIPRDFLTDNYNNEATEHCKAWGLTEENKEQWIDCVDPENEFYWESWDELLDKCILVDSKGNEFTLYQNDDLWAIPEGYDNEDFFNN